MRVCDLQTGVIRLTKAAKKLKDSWEETRAHWNDQKMVAFDQDYLQHLAPQITLTLAAVNRFSQLVDKMERDCRDEDRLE